MQSVTISEYPISTGGWVCSQCGKGPLRKAYPCELCHAVLCDGCVDSEHEQPTSEHGLICGESRDMFQQLESD